MNVPSPFSERKPSTSGRRGTAGTGKSSPKKIAYSLADQASYTVRKRRVCPVRNACEKTATFLALFILLFSETLQYLACGTFAKAVMNELTLNFLGLAPW